MAVISKTLFGDCCQIGGAVTRRNIYLAGNVCYSLTLYLRKLKLEDTYVDTPTLVELNKLEQDYIECKICL